VWPWPVDELGAAPPRVAAWPRSPDELVAAQRHLAVAGPRVWSPEGGGIACGGCAVRFPRGESGPGRAGQPAWAAAVVMRGRRLLAQSVVAGAAAAPYAPGLLALREGPLLEAAVGGLDVVPEVVLVDATGRDHPRRAGLALHLGAVLGRPTVGVTHRPLLAAGEWPDDVRGAWSWLVIDGERVGAWVRTRPGVRPLAVHAGWATTVEVAVAVVLGATGRHRTPEPLRQARRLARSARAA
jgi:deoxyribonuclease V